jgi:hypothetical protein
MLISVRTIKLTCEWHKAIKLNYKKTRTQVILVLTGSKHYTWHAQSVIVEYWRKSVRGISVIWHGRGGQTCGTLSADKVQCVDPPEDHTLSLHDALPISYVKVYRYNPKHLCPKLNGYRDNGQRSLKLWQLLDTYWLPNTY